MTPNIYFFVLLLFLIFKIWQAYQSSVKERHAKLAGPHPITTNPDCLVYNGKNLKFTKAEMDAMLVKHFPYYRALNEDLKHRFLQRLHIFIRQKVFIIRSKEGYKEMPVLLSAAAIQITFGLPNFRLPFFKFIQIHPEEYFADNSFRVLAGHVYGSTITVAWNHFYKNYQLADGVNVGLHEMAHALYFQHSIADSIKKRKFVMLFEEVMAESQEVYDGCRQTASKLFTPNAFKDLQEFWAESLEIFFEKPVQMNVLYPDLFHQLCMLLQQNPIHAQAPAIAARAIDWSALDLQLPNLKRLFSDEKHNR